MSTAISSHIVGGELQMIHQRGESYLLRLILYYDQANAQYNLIDRDIELGIYRSSNHTKIDETTIELSKSFLLDYANPNCLPDTLKTIKIIYEGIHRFSGDRYTEPEGYYLSWERCCRNNIISNVFQPGRQGMVFLLEFASVSDYPMNSSPTFNEVMGEYICRDRYIEMDFGATDPDGDSLNFLLATPLAGFTSPDQPMSNLLPGPYPNVENYFLMPGSPYLSIDRRSGLLKVRPSQNGLYVFRVMCEEYRNGKRIGAIHRDFQILVNNCEDNLAPITQIILPNGNEYKKGDTILIDSREDLCSQLLVTDQDPEDEITFEIIPLNFLEKSPTFNPESGQINDPEDTLHVKMCWPDCEEPENDSIYNFILLVKDNACPRRNTDSIQIVIKVREEDNSKPEIDSEYENIEWPVGDLFSMSLFGQDMDLDDSLTFSLFSLGTNLNENIFQESFGNVINGTLTLTAKCDDLSEETYDYFIYVKDNSCASNNKDSIPFSVLINDFIPYEREVTAPTNVITPNGDGFNEYFFFSQPVGSACEFQDFESVTIYNRWGREIYFSIERDFRWSAENVSSGNYFYYIKFDNSAYKGFIHVIK